MKLIFIASILAIYFALASTGGTAVSSTSPCRNTINSGQCLLQGEQIGSCNGLWIIIITADGWIIIIYVPTNKRKTIFANEGKCNSVQLCVDENGNLDVICDGSKEQITMPDGSKANLTQNKAGGKVVLANSGRIQLRDSNDSPSGQVDYFADIRNDL